MGASQRRKGGDAERHVAAHMRDNGWPEARRYLAGDGNQPGDIDAIPGVCIEVKDQRTYRIAEWLAQATDEAGPDRLPVVVMHPQGVSNKRVGEWWAIVRFDDMLDLLRDQP